MDSGNSGNSTGQIAAEKAALRGILDAIGDVQAKALAERIASIQSQSLLYAIANPARSIRPGPSRLRDVAREARSMAAALLAAAEEAERVADGQ